MTPNAPLENEMSGGVDAVDLENRFCEIETDSSDRHGWLLI